MSREIILKLGVVPVKRGAWFTSAENALISKNNAFEALKGLHPNVELITVDGVIPDGIAHSNEHIKTVTDYLTAKAVDAVFILHTDFGSEEVIAKIGKEMEKPLLLWGARDDSPGADGSRLRDTQCGIFASSKVLSRLGVKFTYIENCYAHEKTFINGVNDFCRTASVLKVFKGMRILKIGDRPSGFLSVMYDEGELLTKFGIEVVPLSVGRFAGGVKKLKERNDADVAKRAESIAHGMNTEAVGAEELLTLAAMIVFVKSEMDKGNFAGASIECWSGLSELFGILPCQLIGELTAMGYPVSCEGDVCGAITSVMLHAADFNKTPSFFADLTVRHPERDNAELLWHCGPFPLVLAGANEKPAIDKGGRGQWVLKQGKLTIARFDSSNGEYSMFLGEANTTEGPETHGTYVWMEADDWVKWEKAIVYGPYIHHVSCIYGHCAKVLAEACEYIKGLKADLM
jgi:L-fucose isomerase-like protein